MFVDKQFGPRKRATKKICEQFPSFPIVFHAILMQTDKLFSNKYDDIFNIQSYPWFSFNFEHNILHILHNNYLLLVNAIAHKSLLILDAASFPLFRVRFFLVPMQVGGRVERFRTVRTFVQRAACVYRHVLLQIKRPIKYLST